MSNETKRLAIDVASLTFDEFTPPAEWVRKYVDEGILFYHSECGEKPMIIGGEVMDGVFVDVSTKEGKDKLKEYQKRSKHEMD